MTYKGVFNFQGEVKTFTTEAKSEAHAKEKLLGVMASIYGFSKRTLRNYFNDKGNCEINLIN